jgi:hypothetical protein
MLKHVYRGIILVAVFIGALVYFQSNIGKEEVKETETIKMGNASFPVLYIKSKDHTINLMHGYSSNINAGLVRDSITPIDDDKTIEVLIDQNKNDIKKINYEVRGVSDDALVDSGSIAALEQNKNSKTAKIRLKAELEQGTEYALVITAVTDTSKKIHYYTRVKYIANAHVSENIDFIMNFHNSILDKKKANDVIIYLEPDITADNDTLAHVTINSSFELVSFKNLNPKVVGEVVPTVKETNAEVSLIELKYKVAIKNGKKNAYYNIKENYRVRYTSGRMYLLNYDRTMEAIFDINLSNLSTNELNLGITNEEKTAITTSSDNTKLSFVKNRFLWYYDLTNNKVVDVFSFEDNDTKDIRETYDQHNIRILGMEDNGDIDFMVYGYMNRGYYEGKVSIVLYKYYSEENRIEEQVYIPIDIPYQLLKENLDSFSYVNQGKVFYFSINQNIYAYNIVSNELNEIATNINNENLFLSKEGKFIAWQDKNDVRKSKKIIIMDLETGKQNELIASKNENIKILGTINANIIYGYANTKDITEDIDGSTIVPLYKVQIADREGISLMEYEKNGYYVVNSMVKDNIIELTRVKKKSGGSNTSYSKAESDYILNQAKTTTSQFGLMTVSSEDYLLESFIKLPDTVALGTNPSISKTINTVINDETALHLDGSDQLEEKYYVYALGEIVSSYGNAGDAIMEADSKFGVVLDSRQMPIWQRGEKASRQSLTISNPVYVSQEINSIAASLKMILSYAGVEVSSSTLAKSKLSMHDTLEKYLKDSQPINLTGANLDEVLYYISKGYPIIGMKSENRAVLIISYDEFNIKIIDPSTMQTTKIGLGDASKLFEDAGNVFISYYN